MYETLYCKIFLPRLIAILAHDSAYKARGNLTSNTDKMCIDERERERETEYSLPVATASWKADGLI